MFKTKKSLMALFIMVFAITTIGATAAITWSQSISWTWQTTSSFTVAENTSVNLGTLSASSPDQVQTYTVTNNGDVSVTVYPHTAGSGFSASWDKSSMTLSPGASGTFQLTLTVVGSGSCTATINTTP